MAAKKLDTNPLKLKIDGLKLFLENNSEKKLLTPDMRTLEGMKTVVYSKEFYEKADKSTPLYFMYRGICRAGDKQLFEKYGIRYDVTLIPYLELGEEYNKTLGHYHPLASGNLSYTEVYEVLEGEAHYLLQKKVEKEVEDAVLIKAGKGDRVIIPPNYGHVTINPKKKTLVMCNLVFSGFKSEYKEYEEMHGAAYLEFLGDKLFKNASYGRLPGLRVLKAKKIFDGNIYGLFLKNPEKFSFLWDPKLISDYKL